MKQFVKFLIPLFGLIAIFGAVLASGRLGEGGLALAFGITFIVVGVVGIVNVMLFTRLRAMIDEAAEKERAGGSVSEADSE